MANFNDANALAILKKMRSPAAAFSLEERAHIELRTRNILNHAHAQITGAGLTKGDCAHLRMCPTIEFPDIPFTVRMALGALRLLQVSEKIDWVRVFPLDAKFNLLSDFLFRAELSQEDFEFVDSRFAYLISFFRCAPLASRERCATFLETLRARGMREEVYWYVMTFGLGSRDVEYLKQGLTGGKISVRCAIQDVGSLFSCVDGHGKILLLKRGLDSPEAITAVSDLIAQAGTTPFLGLSEDMAMFLYQVSVVHFPRPFDELKPTDGPIVVRRKIVGGLLCMHALRACERRDTENLGQHLAQKYTVFAELVRRYVCAEADAMPKTSSDKPRIPDIDAFYSIPGWTTGTDGAVQEAAFLRVIFRDHTLTGENKDLDRTNRYRFYQALASRGLISAQEGAYFRLFSDTLFEPEMIFGSVMILYKEPVLRSFLGATMFEEVEDAGKLALVKMGSISCNLDPVLKAAVLRATLQMNEPEYPALSPFQVKFMTTMTPVWDVLTFRGAVRILNAYIRARLDVTIPKTFLGEILKVTPTILALFDRDEASITDEDIQELAQNDCIALFHILKNVRKNGTPLDVMHMDQYPGPAQVFYRTQTVIANRKKAVEKKSVVVRLMEALIWKADVPAQRVWTIMAHTHGATNVVALREALDYGADMYALSPDGEPLLHVVNAPGRQELMNRGVDPDQRDSQGRTALMLPDIDAQTSLRLLLYGADPNIVAHNGDSALSRAVFNRSSHAHMEVLTRNILLRSRNLCSLFRPLQFSPNATGRDRAKVLQSAIRARDKSRTYARVVMLAALPGLKRLETEVHMIIGQMLGIGLPAESIEEAGKAVVPKKKPMQIKFPRETLLRLDIEKLFSVFHKERREVRARGDVVHPTASLPQEFAREIRNLKRLLFLYQYKDDTHEASECVAEVEVLEALRELYVLKRNPHAWAQGQEQYESELEAREAEYEDLMPREYERYVDPEEERAMMHDEAALLTVRRGE